uniref:CCD97-like C-terminal domain-containing protein n=2 Tax=Oryza sativa subsp. japonica TaxID=39947 RepID=Q8S818_ORYSJ|nr:Hypothetical protein [Oryza sativa Japonica Group]AAP51958.1 hypothetical protein LOC_Os10g03710 [Oryza sativa Japonica Group]
MAIKDRFTGNPGRLTALATSGKFQASGEDYSLTRGSAWIEPQYTAIHEHPNSHLGQMWELIQAWAAFHGRMVDSNKTGGSPAGTSKQTLSAEEMDDQLEQFTSLMQQKFLSGEDFGHMDYSRIDNDEMLDDHWSKEANYDAGEKYFEED